MRFPACSSAYRHRYLRENAALDIYLRDALANAETIDMLSKIELAQFYRGTIKRHARVAANAPRVIFISLQFG